MKLQVETIGDAYMVLGGAPNVCPPSDAAEKVSISSKIDRSVQPELTDLSKIDRFVSIHQTSAIPS